MRDKNAEFLEIEPGDGSRYQVMIAERNNKLYVAIGPGDVIRGGYWMPLDIDEIEKIVSSGRILNHHFIQYWGYHAGIAHYWTAAVAVLCGYFYLTQQEKWTESIPRIGDLYKGRFAKEIT